MIRSLPQGLTAVLITSTEAATSRILYGNAVEQRPHPRGAVALVPPGEIVVYSFRAKKPRTFAFRTLASPDIVTSTVVGVSPGVRLLVHAQSAGRLRRLEELLGYLQRLGLAPSSLSDLFYLRLHAVLSGRLPRGKLLGSLLADEESFSTRA